MVRRSTTLDRGCCREGDLLHQSCYNSKFLSLRANQSLDLKEAVVGVVNVSGSRVNGGQCRHCAHKHSHRVGVVAEVLHELPGGFVQHGVVRDLVHPAEPRRSNAPVAADPKE